MCVLCFVLFFFVKQKTAYEMRISDWSSDVCSSDLAKADDRVQARQPQRPRELPLAPPSVERGLAEIAHVDRRFDTLAFLEGARGEIGRASCRGRVCQYV